MSLDFIDRNDDNDDYEHLVAFPTCTNYFECMISLNLLVFNFMYIS